MTRYIQLGAKALLTLAFVGAGLAKISGVEMMVETFDTLGLGQWFRYVTGAIEITAALLLWVPGLIGLGAALLTATMFFAVLSHILILGPSAMPATVLGLISAYVAWTNRKDIPVVNTMLT